MEQVNIRKTSFDLFNIRIDSSEVARRLLEALVEFLKLRPHGSACFQSNRKGEEGEWKSDNCTKKWRI